MTKIGFSISTLLLALGILSTACSPAFASTAKPSVAIISPASNSQFHAGDQVTIQSTSTDPEGITQVELSVDGTVVRTDPSPQPQSSFTVDQQWIATVGSHVITVRALNSASVYSEVAAVAVNVLPIPFTPTPLPTPTVAANGACVNNSAFVADITVPDGTALAPNQTFNKIWRVRNTGTCTWGAGDALVFIGGESLSATTAIAAPNTAPGATADLLVPMAAPAVIGGHSGSWRLKSPSGALFGATLTTIINVVGPAVPNCPFTPGIASFQASPSTITLGQSTNLSWGFVSGAQYAQIDNGIGGVATPGSTTVSPTTSTTYTLTAVCGSKVNSAQVTVTVVNPPPAPTNTPNPPPTATTAPTNTPTPTPTATSKH
jgi:hypothetical protein